MQRGGNQPPDHSGLLVPLGSMTARLHYEIFWSNPLGNVPKANQIRPLPGPCFNRCFANSGYFKVKRLQAHRHVGLANDRRNAYAVARFRGRCPVILNQKTKGRGLLLPFLNPSRQYPLWVTAVPQRGGFFIFAAPVRAGS